MLSQYSVQCTEVLIIRIRVDASGFQNATTESLFPFISFQPVPGRSGNFLDDPLAPYVTAHCPSPAAVTLVAVLVIQPNELAASRAQLVHGTWGGNDAAAVGARGGFVGEQAAVWARAADNVPVTGTITVAAPDPLSCGANPR